ncbi:TRAP transporter small permease [Aquabacter sp. CN5-332]|uniref:TRAP transporter small permease n=1 Tax=Aquabacter sp. CN5-332 TaxID=3156608 RepID=UPI0032B4124D
MEIEPPPPHREARLEEAARRLFNLTAAVLVPAITLLITADAVMRYALDRSFAWAQDIAGLGLFILFCAGLPYSWYGQFHVRMDLVYDILPRIARRSVDVISFLAAVTVAGTLAAYAMEAVFTSYTNQVTMPLMPLPIWPVVLFGALCCVFFCLTMIAWIYGRLTTRRGATWN